MEKEIKSKEDLSKEISDQFKSAAEDLAKEILVTNKHLAQMLSMKCVNDYMKEHTVAVDVPDEEANAYSQKVVDAFIDHFVEFFL